MTDPRLEEALGHVATELRKRGKGFALVGMKLLAAREGRARDWDDALGLLHVNATLDLELVRQRLALISSCGFARNEDLPSKLDLLLARRDRA